MARQSIELETPGLKIPIDKLEKTVARMSAASSSDKFVEIYKQTLDDVAIWKIINS